MSQLIHETRLSSPNKFQHNKVKSQPAESFKLKVQEAIKTSEQKTQNKGSFS